MLNAQINFAAFVSRIVAQVEIEIGQHIFVFIYLFLGKEIRFQHALPFKLDESTASQLRNPLNQHEYMK